MGFWDSMRKDKETGDSNPEDTDKQATENIEKSKREEFLDRLKVDVNDKPEYSDKVNDPENKPDDDADDVDNDISNDAPEREIEAKSRDDDDDNIR